jgi:hypothetical protein
VEATQKLLTAGVALCGLAIVILSFLTWVRFEAEGAVAGRPTVVEISGIETSMWRDDESIDEHSAAPHGIGWCSCEVGFGDGYITAVLGLVLVALASVAALTDFTGRALIGGIAAALAALVVAGFNAFADWSALVSVTSAGTTVAAEGEVQWALYALLAAAALAAVLAAAGWVADWAYEKEEEYDYEPEDTSEGTGESWA